MATVTIAGLSFVAFIIYEGIEKVNSFLKKIFFCLPTYYISDGRKSRAATSADGIGCGEAEEIRAERRQ